MEHLASPSPSQERFGRAFVWLLLLGATLGSALDGIHTHFGATVYARPILWKMAWWTPVLFGAAFTIGLMRPLLDRRKKSRVAPPNLGTVLLSMALFIGAYFTTVLPLPWTLVTAILCAIFALSYITCDRSAVGLGIALTAAIGGPLIESILVACGTFVHVRPIYFNVSGWLPFLYLSASVALTTLARWLVTP